VEVRFSVPVLTESGAHPASYAVGIGYLSWRKSGWGVALIIHPPSSAEVKERVELYLYSLSALS
jgi:hypothetical protein